ncbi:hypothetical protein Pflav_065840 [Phytohabitans flavus]|uniref:Class I SAM-dependent methyltransferase n=1 Tax=Phytohabitans flavus TaxID=1076124 RepID=A0A6F8Y237_9ACTN|nr:hypothetical protein Pflav_065840 [Phytohabitans flavus]
MPARPQGEITRGTTNPNRLRRVDRWIAARLGGTLRDVPDPLVVDLGYGESPVTTVELHSRLTAVRPDVRVVGLEIDPARVAAAAPVAEPRVSRSRAAASSWPACAQWSYAPSTCCASTRRRPWRWPGER